MKLSQISTPRPTPSIDDRIMPLINIVFLLLIFFLVAGIIREPDPMDITPPESIAQKLEPDEMLSLYVGANADIALAGHIVDKAAFPSQFAALIAEQPDIPIRIVADRAVDTVDILEVMEILQKAGAVKVTLATEISEGVQ